MLFYFLLVRWFRQLDLYHGKFFIAADLNLPSGGGSGKIARHTALTFQLNNNQLRQNEAAQCQE